MPQVNAPFGLRPVYSQAGTLRGDAIPAGIGSGYGTNIFQNSPVQMSAGGTIVLLTSTSTAAAGDFIGSFQGVEYTDNTGKPTSSNFWPASTAGTIQYAYVAGYKDTTMIFEIQADGTVASTSVGDQAAFVAGDLAGTAGSTLTGLSTARMSSTLKGAGTQGQVSIVGKSLAPDNEWLDPFTVVQVRISQHQMVANKVAI
jgi:hypothetical protein